MSKESITGGIIFNYVWGFLLGASVSFAVTTGVAMENNREDCVKTGTVTTKDDKAYCTYEKEVEL